jgi:hypothetical protein
MPPAGPVARAAPAALSVSTSAGEFKPQLQAAEVAAEVAAVVIPAGLALTAATARPLNRATLQLLALALRLLEEEAAAVAEVAHHSQRQYQPEAAVAAEVAAHQRQHPTAVSQQSEAPLAELVVMVALAAAEAAEAAAHRHRYVSPLANVGAWISPAHPAAVVANHK